MNPVQDHVMELLRNYRSYRFAVSQGIHPYREDDRVGMPRVGGFASLEPSICAGDTRLTELDYKKYKRAVWLISAAVEDVLDDDSQRVIKLRYMERNALTIDEIAERLHTSRTRVYRLHDKSIASLCFALRFVDAPEIMNLDHIFA